MSAREMREKTRNGKMIQRRRSFIGAQLRIRVQIFFFFFAPFRVFRGQSHLRDYSVRLLKSPRWRSKLISLSLGVASLACGRRSLLLNLVPGSRFSPRTRLANRTPNTLREASR